MSSRSPSPASPMHRHLHTPPPAPAAPHHGLARPADGRRAGVLTDERHALYQRLRDRAAKGALSMIDWANHKPDNRGVKPKVGGHQASSMSSADILSALYLHTLRPEDRLCVKPHAAPVVYALAHMMGLMTRDQIMRLRELGGPQPYPTKLKNPRLIDYTASSEGLGVATTIYDAYGATHQNRALTKTLGAAPVTGTYWAHCGDGELTEGQVDESLYDAGRWRLSNLVWIIDLNRQSLDRVMDDAVGTGRLEDWVAAKFLAQGWSVDNVRWGSRARALFDGPGGPALKALVEGMSDALFHPLLGFDGPLVRAVLTGVSSHEDPAIDAVLRAYRERLMVSEETFLGVRRALAGISDAELTRAISHLGGHDLRALAAAFERARAAEGPVCIVAHTVKGYETSAAGHPENHGGLLPAAEVHAWGVDRGLPAGEPYPLPSPGSADARHLDLRREALFGPARAQWLPAPVDAHAAVAAVPHNRRATISTGEAFQSLNVALLRTAIGPYLQFGAPDVGQTTHLGPIIRSTGVFAPWDQPPPIPNPSRSRALAFDWRPEATGQFHAFGIAEGNAMLWAYAFGRRRGALEGRVPVLPVVTVYDKFFERGFNQLDYAVYSGARFVAVGTPSGTGLSRETATHQSLQTLRMMMDLPGIIAYEPAFAADVHAIYRHALATLWDEDAEAVYLRLTTVPLSQPTELPEDHEEQAVAGGYWLVGEDDRAPADGQPCVVFVASGRKLAEARAAAEVLRREDGVGSRILNVTSYEALWRDWDAFNADPSAWDDPSRTYRLHDLFDDALVNAPLIMTGDHLPSVCEWLPGALQRTRGYRFLGPRTNGEAGALQAVDALHGMATADLVRAARDELAWRRRDGSQRP